MLGGLLFGVLAYQKSRSDRVEVETALDELSRAPLDEVANLARRLATHPGLARPRLRALRETKGPDPNVALHATLALLEIDENAATAFERRMSDNPPLARQMVLDLLAIGRKDEGRFDRLRDLLRQVRRPLLNPLKEEVRSRAHFDEAPHDDQAARLLLDYAADAPEVLADAVPDVSLKLLPEYLQRLDGSRKVATQRLEGVLREPLAGWNDPTPDATWTSPDPALVKRLESAGGGTTATATWPRSSSTRLFNNGPARAKRLMTLEVAFEACTQSFRTQALGKTARG